MGSAWFLALIIAIPLGIHNSRYPYGASDIFSTTLSLIGFSMPTFWLALMVQQTFAFQLLWLPPSSMHSTGHEDIPDLIMHMIMPVFVLTFGFLASYLKYTRSSFLEVISSDYIRTARAKGASERRVIYRHAFRNALIPLITVLALDFPQLIGGSAIVEIIFNWNGMGHELFVSAETREYTTMMAIVVITSVAVIAANWVADILYAIVDPRIRTTQHWGGVE
jgi:peptide/nickel transport system permease protein